MIKKKEQLESETVNEIKTLKSNLIMKKNNRL